MGVKQDLVNDFQSWAEACLLPSKANRRSQKDLFWYLFYLIGGEWTLRICNEDGSTPATWISLLDIVSLGVFPLVRSILDFTARMPYMEITPLTRNLYYIFAAPVYAPAFLLHVSLRYAIALPLTLITYLALMPWLILVSYQANIPFKRLTTRQEITLETPVRQKPALCWMNELRESLGSYMADAQRLVLEVRKTEQHYTPGLVLHWLTQYSDTVKYSALEIDVFDPNQLAFLQDLIASNAGNIETYLKREGTLSYTDAYLSETLAKYHEDAATSSLDVLATLVPNHLLPKDVLGVVHDMQPGSKPVPVTSELNSRDFWKRQQTEKTPLRVISPPHYIKV